MWWTFFPREGSDVLRERSGERLGERSLERLHANVPTFCVNVREND